jgi:hypothetical protein
MELVAGFAAKPVLTFWGEEKSFFFPRFEHLPAAT